jgi:hypothetical protein
MSTSVTARTFETSRGLGSRRRRTSQPLAATLIFALLAACQHGGGPSGVQERLDEKSGITVVADERPVVFARTETRYSRSGRDYLYLGPVGTNRQGVREYYLWVGVASTLDRGYIAPDGAIPERLFIDLEGEPMELVLLSWRDREPVLAEAGTYSTPVRVREELAARVTLDQLAALARGPLRSLRVRDHEGNERAYFRWDEEPTWPRFLAAVESPDGAPPVRPQ